MIYTWWSLVNSRRELHNKKESQPNEVVFTLSGNYLKGVLRDNTDEA